MAAKYSLDRDLAEAQAMAESLLDYARGDQLYGTVDGLFGTDPDMPTLTLGQFLLRLHRLQAQESAMTPEQKAILTMLESSDEMVRQGWTVHYNGKLVDEAQSRLNSIVAFLSECEDDEDGCAGSYLPNALDRTLVQVILDTLDKYNLPHPDLKTELSRHDAQFHRFTEPSAFVWDERLAPLYPKDKYFWLYERPVEQRARQRR
jgi:hypothetical protein